MSTNFPANDLKPPQGSNSDPSAPAATPASNPADAERLKRIEEQNTLLTSALEDLKNQNAYLLGEVKKSQPAAPPAEPPVDPKTEWWTNPEEAFNRRLGPVVQSFAASAEALIRAEMTRLYPKEFKHFGKEIDALMSGVSPQYRTQQQSWEYAINQVRGMHLKDYLTNPDLVVAFSEPASGGGAISTATPKSAAEQLTESELRSAKNWGITPEKYLEQKKKQTVAI